MCVIQVACLCLCVVRVCDDYAFLCGACMCALALGTLNLGLFRKEAAELCGTSLRESTRSFSDMRFHPLHP